jgi:hypothetical protein
MLLRYHVTKTDQWDLRQLDINRDLLNAFVGGFFLLGSSCHVRKLELTYEFV